VAISGTWKAANVINDAYVGAQRWGTGIDPIHSVRDQYHKPVTTKLPLESTTAGEVVPDSIVEPTDWGYCAGDYAGGIHDYREIEEDHPGTPERTLFTREVTRKDIPGNWPEWGASNTQSDDFPLASPTQPGTDFLSVRHASPMELSHSNSTPYSDSRGIAGGWAHKARGAQLEAHTSDPSQYEINTSMRQVHGSSTNDRAVARYVPDLGGSSPRTPIKTRTAGMKAKTYARGVDMFPIQQDLPYRPFFYRSAGVPPMEQHSMNTMEGRAPIQHTVSPDPYQGDYSGTAQAEDNNYGYSTGDYYG
jgi:hypothetical protein